MWQLLTGGISGIIQGGFGVVKTWLEGRQKKTQAKIAVQERIISGEIDYNIAAQRGMAASIKDEILTIWTVTLVSLHFYPPAQPYLELGWKNLRDVAPDWFGWCFMGMYVAVFGLKGYKMKKNGGG